MKTFTIVKKKGRWGTIHWEIKELVKGDYQSVKNFNYVFDGYEGAKLYLIKNYGSDVNIKYEER
jgi:hypothetical protein